MSNYTAYLNHDVGTNLYAKARPLSTPWATGVINGAPLNGGEFSFLLDTDTEYAVFERATDTPLDTDMNIGSFGTVGLNAASVRSALGLSAADLDTQLDAIAANAVSITTSTTVVESE